MNGFVQPAAESGMPGSFYCRRCAACCRWPGQVCLAEGETSVLASFLGMTEHDFIQKYTRVDAARRGLALTEKENGECVFLDGSDCRIQPVKPKQCREFPHTWSHPGYEMVCLGAGGTGTWQSRESV